LQQLYKISGILTNGEIYVMPLLLILFVIFRKRKIIFEEVLISYNYLKLILITYYLILFAAELINLYLQLRNSGEFINFKYRISGLYGWETWLFPIGISFYWYYFF
jgi:hypothetical protein